MENVIAVRAEQVETIIRRMPRTEVGRQLGEAEEQLERAVLRR